MTCGRRMVAGVWAERKVSQVKVRDSIFSTQQVSVELQGGFVIRTYIIQLYNYIYIYDIYI